MLPLAERLARRRNATRVLTVPTGQPSEKSHSPANAHAAVDSPESTKTLELLTALTLGPETAATRRPAAVAAVRQPQKSKGGNARVAEDEEWKPKQGDQELPTRHRASSRLALTTGNHSFVHWMTHDHTLHVEDRDFRRCEDVWKAVPITSNRVQSNNECVLYATWNGIETLVGPLAAPPPFVTKLMDKTDKNGMLMRTLHERADFQRQLQQLGLKAQYTYQEYSRTKMGADAARLGLESGVVLVGLKFTGQSGSLARVDPNLPDSVAHMTCIVGYLELVRLCLINVRSGHTPLCKLATAYSSGVVTSLVPAISPTLPELFPVCMPLLPEFSSARCSFVALVAAWRRSLRDQGLERDGLQGFGVPARPEQTSRGISRDVRHFARQAQGRPLGLPGRVDSSFPRCAYAAP